MVKMKSEFTYVLLLDNNGEDRQNFKDALENLKMKTIVKMVNDGNELLRYLSSPDTESPDILFIDRNMQGKAGIDYLQLIKNLHSAKDITIAIYSSNASQTEIETSFVKGANVYINKPNDFQVFKKKLENVLAMNWHYISSGLNRENFILSL